MDHYRPWVNPSTVQIGFGRLNVLRCIRRDSLGGVDLDRSGEFRAVSAWLRVIHLRNSREPKTLCLSRHFEEKPRPVRPGFYALSVSRSGGSCHLACRLANSASRLAGSPCHLTSSLASSTCRLADSACRLASRLAGSPCHLTSSFAGSACRLARGASCRRHSFSPIRF
jgi:hypothetical protein